MTDDRTPPHLEYLRRGISPAHPSGPDACVREQLEAVAEGFRRGLEAVTPALTDVANRLVRAAETRPDLIRLGPPTDPRERALWLRRHRNTGPGPGRLDGRKTRR